MYFCLHLRLVACGKVVLCVFEFEPDRHVVRGIPYVCGGGGGAKRYPASFILRQGLLVFVWRSRTTALSTNQPTAVVVGTGVRVFIWGNGEGAEGK